MKEGRKNPDYDSTLVIYYGTLEMGDYPNIEETVVIDGTIQKIDNRPKADPITGEIDQADRIRNILIGGFNPNYYKEYLILSDHDVCYELKNDLRAHFCFSRNWRAAHGDKLMVTGPYVTQLIDFMWYTSAARQSTHDNHIARECKDNLEEFLKTARKQVTEYIRDRKTPYMFIRYISIGESFDDEEEVAV